MNKSRFGIWSIVMSVILMGVAVACSEEVPPLADNEVAFETSIMGFADEDVQTSITIELTRSIESAKTITVSLVPTGVEYGVEFTTTPAAVGSIITLTVPAGSHQTSFTVAKEDGILLDGDESILYTIQSADEPLVISEAKTLELKFSPIVSEGSQLQLNGLIAAESGSSAGNSVFVDFSANQQSPVVRVSWDVGFYSGDDFRVILNNTIGASAVIVNKTDLNLVTEADVDAADLAIGNGSGSFDVYDSINGNLSNTAIGEISATPSDNKVYVINRIGGSGTTQAVTEFVKIRIIRNGSGYTLQYAKVNDVTFQTVNIEKNAQSTFRYFHFDNGATEVEPAKDRWDIEWTWSIFATNFGGGNVPYAFSDLVFINHHNGVKADTVFTADVTYDNFSEADIDDYELVSKRNIIGSGWRATTGTVGVKTDRFYVVEDSKGNVYKLKFVSFHASDGGMRGKPVIQYALVKKAD